MTTLTLYPVDDGYGDAANVNTNYDANGYLAVGSNNPTPRYAFYMKFDLSTLAGKNVTSAKFRLKCRASAGSEEMYIKKVADDTWTEETLTWNNKPAAGDTIYTGAMGESVGWNEHQSTEIAAYAEAEKGGFMSVAYTGGTVGGYNFYYDKEDSGGANKPELVVEWIYKVTISETLGMSDSLAPRADFKQAISESLGAVDSASAGLGMHVTISDSLGMRDRVDSRKHKTKIDDLPDDTITGGA